ncbi:uncharacterized protein OCT59_006063 [Rhizophagus irregularis]|uniref:uncharacterized protein n=1 Tax=Rhizophagus irregularis TaxID=588596 RepID=UPI003316B8C0|nr:hypothetical protein OCT59_006063 [Rhizophagus irregularis]
MVLELYLDREWLRLKVDLTLFLRHRVAQFVAISTIVYFNKLFIRRNLQYIQFKVTLPKLEIKFVFIGLIDDKTKLYILNLGYFINPIEHGADIVYNRGIMIDGGKSPWNNGGFTIFTNPSSDYHGLIYWDIFGYNAFTTKARSEIMRNVGPCQNPFGSFLLIQGFEALSLRVHTGSYSHPYHENAKKYMRNGFGCILDFGVKGDANVGAAFFTTCKLLQRHINN